MRAVYLYGPPGVGKLTVAQELAALTRFKLLHNHLSVNLVTALFPFQSRPWLRLLRQVRQDVFTAASAENVDIVITSVFNGTAETAEAWRVMAEPIYAGGGTIFWVRLTCAFDELLRRVQLESRKAYDKLTDPQVLVQQHETRGLFPAVPFQPHVDLDITALSPASSAARIAEYFDLPRGR